MKKKIFSLFMAVLMCFSMLPTTIFAAVPEDCDHILTAENISEIPADFWDTHSHADYHYAGEVNDDTTYDEATDAIISITQPETCTQDGWTMKRDNGSGYCMICKELIGEKETIPAKQHNFEKGAVLKEADCRGGSVVECANSYDVIEWNNYYDAEVTNVKCHETTQLDDKKDHTWGPWEVTIEPECEKQGLNTRRCDVCSQEETMKTDAKEHVYKSVEELPATCTDEGHTAGQVCELCGKTDVKKLDPLGHEYQLVDEQKASCDVAGFKKYQCSRCYDEYVDKIDALGHDLDPDSWVTQLEPTCDKDGYATQDCKREGCGKTQIKVLPAIGHDWQLTNRVAPSCKTNGYEDYVCNNDSQHTKRVVLDALGHQWSEELKEIKPDCTNPGKKYYECQRCGEEDVIETSDPLGHDFGSWEVTLEASCTAPGEKRRDCNREGCEYFETEAIPATGHNVKITKTVEPTCVKDGYNVWACQNSANGVKCTYSFIEPLDRLGHLVPEAYDELANCVHGNQYVCQRELKNEDGSTYICNEFVDDGERNYNLIFTEDSDITKAESIDIPAEEIPEGADLYVSSTGYFNIDYSIVDGKYLTGHHYSVQFVAARCEFDAYYIYTCDNDGCPENAEVPNHQFIVAIANTAIGHKWALRDDNTNIDPSCTEDGTRYWYCLNDHNHVYTEKIPATGHNFVLIDTVDATCTEGGYNLYECQNVTNDNDPDSTAGTKCGAQYKEYITSAIPHNYRVTDSVAATCTTEGYDVYTCAMCGDTYNKTTTPVKPHDYKVSGSVAATCTTEGYDIYTCTACGETYNKTTTHQTGHTFVADSFTDATCTQAGYTTYVCINSGCDASYNSDFITAKGHNYVKEVFAPTCTQQGYTQYVCDVCDEVRKGADGNVYKTDITNPVPHVLNTVNTVAPTCGANGEKISECENCDYVQHEVIPATGNHQYSDSIETAATCGVDGVMKHTCDVCGYNYTTVISATGDHKYDEKVTKNPTCAELGEMTYTCSVCGNSYTEELAKTEDHAFTESVETAATCGADGVMKHTCDVCGYNYTTVISATGDHKYDEKVTKNPTCAELGEMTYTCSVCGNSYTEELAKTEDHAFTESVETAATCGVDGVMKHTCDVCGYNYTTVIPALTHNYTYVEKAATCTENGTITATCTNCKNVQEYTIPAKGHIYDTKGVYTPPTCVKDGYTTYTCSVCHKNSITKVEGKALGHTYKAKVTAYSKLNKNGTITKTCVHCGKSSKTDIAAIKTITLSQTVYQYTGSAFRPKVTIKDSKGKAISSKNYTISYSNNKNIGKAKVTIKFKGNYAGTVTKTFKIIPKNVGISVVSTSKKQLKFTWGKVKVCDGYQIQYSTSSAFKSSVKTIYIKSQKTCSKTIKNLKSGKKYYIRIRAYKTVNGSKYYGNWSTTSKTCK